MLDRQGSRKTCLQVSINDDLLNRRSSVKTYSPIAKSDLGREASYDPDPSISGARGSPWELCPWLNAWIDEHTGTRPTIP